MARSSLAARRTSVVVAALLLLTAAVASTSAQTVAPATSKGSSKKSGCSSISGCASCSKNGCTSCKTGADLSGGKCYCAAGFGQYGSANTVPVLTNGGGGGGGSASIACAPCAADSYSAQSKVVGSAKCVACPAGTASPEGSSTCYVEPGFYYDPASGTVKQCPANKYCAGGDFAVEGRIATACPSGTTSPVQSDEIGDCTVPPGSYYDATSGKIIKCPVGSYCPGGPINGEGASQTACPSGATTSSVGASTIAQCTVPPGSYYDEATQTVKKCPVNTYCPGGSIEGGGASPVNCPTGTSFPATGGSVLNDCIVTAGFYWAGTSVVQCPANKWCPGGPIGSSGSVANNCPVGTTSSVQSDALSDCVVLAGNYYDGTSVVTCPAGSYCSGGPVNGAGAVKTACPANSNSVSGSDTLGDCTLNAGYYCAYTGTTCAVTTCTINSYCPGGASVTDTTDNGSDPCPANSVSIAGSDAVTDCKLAPGYYCATYTGSVCSAITLCGVNKYCPGGDSIADPTKPGPKNCPTNTESAAGSDAKADCTLKPGYYCIYDVNDVCAVTLCPALSYCSGGSSVEDAASPGGPIPCPAGQTSQAGAAACVDICSAGQLYCSSTCISPNTDSNNCGACGNVCSAPTTCIAGACSCGSAGNVCPAGSSCQAFGATQTPTCVCTASGLPVSTPQPLACGQTINNNLAVVIYQLAVLPGSTYTINYDAYGIPDRFVVTDGSECGNVLIDTSFVGQAGSGCPESAPCCVSGAGCTGTFGNVCPSSPTAVPQPGGGTGAGSYTFVPTTNVVYVVGYGVCTSTASEFTIVCPP